MEFITPVDFKSRNLFAACGHTAFRLESRDGYGSDVQSDAYQEYLAGEVKLDRERERRKRWLGNVRAAVDEGKRAERVRVVPDPLTVALSFEAWEGKLNTEAGEDIRYLDRARARELGIPYLNHDYWLFDSYLLYRMHFDHLDRLTGVELIEDPAEVVLANRYRDAAWHYATPFDEWYSLHAHECEPKKR